MKQEIIHITDCNDCPFVINVEEVPICDFSKMVLSYRDFPMKIGSRIYEKQKYCYLKTHSIVFKLKIK